MKIILLVAYAIVAFACMRDVLLHSNKTISNMTDGYIEADGMVFNWKIQEQWLICDMQGPMKGWIAVGFNTRSGLEGTNLIMGAVQNGEVVISDRHIVAVGTHQSVSALGGLESAVLMEGSQDESGVHIRFRLPLRTPDEWHHNLEKGRVYHLLMAYSRDPDFGHHSAMRKHFQIKL